MSRKRKLRPVLDGDWRLIGPAPDLKALLPGAERWEEKWITGGRTGEHNAPVDHHIVRDPQGTWHLWGCVRAASVGRILYHWTATDFRQSPWTPTRELIRVDRTVGESLASSEGGGPVIREVEECIQSPFFVHHAGVCHMFYGGGMARPARDARSDSDSQMCLMVSGDARTWKRRINSDGQSRLFTGPGPTRDPCVIRIGGRWHLYYAGTRNNDPLQPVFWCRTSDDLVTWSEPRAVHCDLSLSDHRWGTECPFVVFRDGYYYLFRTQNYYESRTHVFRSEDPLDFGVDDTSRTYVGTFPVAAPEIHVMDDGCEYVSSNHNPPLGTQICRMKWVGDESQE